MRKDVLLNKLEDIENQLLKLADEISDIVNEYVSELPENEWVYLGNVEEVVNCIRENL